MRLNTVYIHNYIFLLLGICILHRVCLAHVELEGPVQHEMDTEDELEGSVASGGGWYGA